MQIKDEPENDVTQQNTDPFQLPDSIRRVRQLQGKVDVQPDGSPYVPTAPRTLGTRLPNQTANAPSNPFPPRHVSLNQDPSMPVPPHIPQMATNTPAPQFGVAAAPLFNTRPVQGHTEELTETLMDERPEQKKTSIRTRPSFPKEKLDKRWIRMDFPSNLVPYDVEEIYIRPFDVEDLELIYNSIETANHSGYLDALDRCISMDLRELTVPDFIYLQYTLRLSSYTRSPYTIEYTSRYGNERIVTVTKRNLQTIMLNMTREEYAEWRAKGVSFPTVRDSEYIIEAESEVDEGAPRPDSWIQQNAQYVYIEPLPDGSEDRSMEAKIRKLRSHKDPDYLVDIQEFAELCEHGVIETIELADDEFKPRDAINFLTSQADQLRKFVVSLADGNDGKLDDSVIAGSLQIAEQADELLAEAKSIQEAMDAGNAYLPKKEVIALRSISAMDMFPANYLARKAKTAKASARPES